MSDDYKNTTRIEKHNRPMTKKNMDSSYVLTMEDKKFLDALEAFGGLLGRAMRATKRSSGYWYQRRKAFPEFAKMWDEARDRGFDKLEDEAIRRATEGTLDPVYYNGLIVGHRIVYANDLLKLLLQGRRAVYRKQRVELTGADGEPIKHASTPTIVELPKKDFEE